MNASGLNAKGQFELTYLTGKDLCSDQLTLKPRGGGERTGAVDTYRSVVESRRDTGYRRVVQRGLGLAVSLAIVMLLVVFWLPYGG